MLFEDVAGRIWAGTDDGLFWLDASNGREPFRRVDLGRSLSTETVAVDALIGAAGGDLSEVACGGAAMSPEIARRVVRLFREISPPAHIEYQLTPHELRLLRMLVEGHNYKTMAAHLDVSVNTISFHMHRS